MKIKVTKEWCMAMAKHEADAEVGAGLIAADPFFDEETAPAEARTEDSRIAFGRLVNLMRRQRKLDLEKLAEDADVDLSELVSIEEDAHHKPEPRTVYQLANYFNVPRPGLMQLSGLSIPKSAEFVDEAVRFAARSESVERLTPEELAALESFIAVLSKQK